MMTAWNLLLCSSVSYILMKKLQIFLLAILSK